MSTLLACTEAAQNNCTLPNLLILVGLCLCLGFALFHEPRK